MGSVKTLYTQDRQSSQSHDDFARSELAIDVAITEALASAQEHEVAADLVEGGFGEVLLGEGCAGDTERDALGGLILRQGLIGVDAGGERGILIAKFLDRGIVVGIRHIHDPLPFRIDVGSLRPGRGDEVGILKDGEELQELVDGFPLACVHGWDDGIGSTTAQASTDRPLLLTVSRSA